MTRRTLFSPFPAPILRVCALALAVAPLLSGCSGVVQHANAAQVNLPDITVSNPFGLDKQGTGVTLTAASGTAAPAGTYPFAAQAVSLTQIQDAQLTANLSPTATLDGGGPLPAQFTVQSLTVNATISAANADGTPAPGGVALPAVQSTGPVTFTLGPDGKTYSAGSGDIALAQQTRLSPADAQALLAIVTGASSKSDVAVVTTTAPVAASSAGLAGRTLTLAFDSSALKVISQ